MKKNVVLILMAMFISTLLSAQTVVFHEDFELSSLDDSVSFSGNPGWHISTIFYNSGLRCDSSMVVLNDSSILVTDSFSTVGNSYVLLEFAHICKIDLFDLAEVWVSDDNGTTWVQLTGAHYLGTGVFGLDGKSFSALSYQIWDGGNNSKIPTNTWWKPEKFDISAIAANKAQVKVKFVLKDGNARCPGGLWLVDRRYKSYRCNR